MVVVQVLLQHIPIMAVAKPQTITTVTVQALEAQQHAPTMVVVQLPTTTTNMAEA